MNRLFTWALAASFALGTFAAADAAKKKSVKLSLRVPPAPTKVIPVSAEARQVTLSVPKLPPAQVLHPPKLEPIPEAPGAPIFQAPVPADPGQRSEVISEVPPSPVYRPLVPPPVATFDIPQTQPVVHAPIEPNYTPVLTAPAIPMFERVRYVSERKKAPDAVTKVIVIKDPTQRRAAAADPERCVAIEICVPPCECEKVTPNKSGNRIRYNYGKYGVEVRIKNGRVVVAYHARK